MKLENELTNLFIFPTPFTWGDFPKYSSNTSLENAYKICQETSKKHYENFPVASLIIPKKIRKHFYSIYAFARYADDIADNKSDLNKATRIRVLANLKYFIEYLNDEGIVQYPILLALRNTINEMQLPIKPFLKLLTAFKLDVYHWQPKTFEELVQYCEYSANPVGELILRLFNEYNEKTAYYSDKITTALQLINFWQDLSIDFQNNRLYLPADLFNKYAKEITGANFDEFDEDKFAAFSLPIIEDLRSMMLDLIKKTENILLEGKNLVSLLKNKRLQFEIKLIVNSAEAMLEKEKQYKFLLFYFGPKLKKSDYFNILVKSILWRY